MNTKFGQNRCEKEYVKYFGGETSWKKKEELGRQHGLEFKGIDFIMGGGQKQLVTVPSNEFWGTGTGMGIQKAPTCKNNEKLKKQMNRSINKNINWTGARKLSIGNKLNFKV